MEGRMMEKTDVLQRLFMGSKTLSGEVYPLIKLSTTGVWNVWYGPGPPYATFASREEAEIWVKAKTVKDAATTELQDQVKKGDFLNAKICSRL